MAVNLDRMRQCLNQFDFHQLFIEELGWNRHDVRLEIPVDGRTFTLSAVAEKCGLAAFDCAMENNGTIPEYPVRRKIVNGFVALGGRELAQAFRLAVGNAMRVRTLIVLPPFGLLAGTSKIDQFSHSTPRW